MNRSVVRILDRAGNVVGGGILIDSHHICTCAHVVGTALTFESERSDPPADEVRVDFPMVQGCPELVGKVVTWYPVPQIGTHWTAELEDIAILRLDAACPPAANIATLYDSPDLWGRSFQAYGFPDGYQGGGAWASGVFQGRVAGGWMQLRDEAQSGIPIQRGFSGCAIGLMEPVRICGMVVAADVRPGRAVSFMIPVGVLLKALPSEVVPNVLRPGDPPVNLPLPLPGSTDLERKLRTAGATDAIVNDALRWWQKATSRRLEYVAASLSPVGAALSDVDDRILLRAHAAQAAIGKPGSDAARVWITVQAALAAQRDTIDRLRIFDGDPDLLLGQLCDLSNRCQFEW